MTAPLTFEVGRRYLNRAGAVLRVIAIHPDARWRFLTCVIERFACGTPADPDHPVKVALCPDGRYFPHDDDSDSDLVAEHAAPNEARRAA